MIVNPDAFTILCFGDSNTFGQPSEGSGRLPIDVRWTGRLQQLLGEGYAVVEEGLGGRTTDLDDPDRDDRNGRTYFQPCLRSHSPLDVVVIMLGNNDLKAKFGRETDAVATALEGYVDNIERTAWTRTGGVPAILLVGPIHIDADQPAFTEQSSEYDAESVRKSRELGAAIRRVADRRNLLFADAASVARAGDDGVHLSRDSHEPLARLIAHEIIGPHPRAT
ncbi:GDSL-like lipase/acylhydrolase family protein [Nocardia nova SH22a]|uniref:GDSL-like lipase/acylhydrolase family protein n=1 Tax=Nocardia nova SH22a TaxID=1415166 RepID=W5TQL4_9NOCA|nr:GDSL-type esterase/lipase family protein [Nocardia nova]AHH21680.1 GDSL-like lipase/acylhydrolase family protein [Nocardia nova SH22a]